MQHSDGVQPAGAAGAKKDAILSRKSRLMAMAQSMLGRDRRKASRRHVSPQDSTHNTNHDAGNLIVNFKSSTQDQEKQLQRRRELKRRLRKIKEPVPSK